MRSGALRKAIFFLADIIWVILRKMSRKVKENNRLSNSIVLLAVGLGQHFNVWFHFESGETEGRVSHGGSLVFSGCLF